MCLPIACPCSGPSLRVFRINMSRVPCSKSCFSGFFAMNTPPAERSYIDCRHSTVGCRQATPDVNFVQAPQGVFPPALFYERHPVAFLERFLIRRRVTHASRNKDRVSADGG